MGGLWSLSCVNHIHNASSMISNSDFIKMEWKIKTLAKQSEDKILVLNNRLVNCNPLSVFHIPNLTVFKNYLPWNISNTQSINKYICISLKELLKQHSLLLFISIFYILLVFSLILSCLDEVLFLNFQVNGVFQVIFYILLLTSELWMVNMVNITLIFWNLMRLPYGI